MTDTFNNQPGSNSLRIARVAAVHPETHSVDVVFFENAGVAQYVPVLTGMASQQYGFAFLPQITEPVAGKWSPALSEVNDQLCVVAMTNLSPVVIGFLHPQIGAMGYEAPDQALFRHPSGAFVKFDGDSTVTVSVPGSGCVLQMGPCKGVQDTTVSLAGDYDQVYKDTGPQCDGKLTIECSGSVITIEGPKVTLTTPNVLVNGNLNVTGDIIAKGDVVGSASGAGVSLTGHYHVDSFGGLTSASINGAQGKNFPDLLGCHPCAGGGAGGGGGTHRSLSRLQLTSDAAIAGVDPSTMGAVGQDAGGAFVAVDGPAVFHASWMLGQKGTPGLAMAAEHYTLTPVGEVGSSQATLLFMRKSTALTTVEDATLLVNGTAFAMRIGPSSASTASVTHEPYTVTHSGSIQDTENQRFITLTGVHTTAAGDWYIGASPCSVTFSPAILDAMGGLSSEMFSGMVGEDVASVFSAWDDIYCALMASPTSNFTTPKIEPITLGIWTFIVQVGQVSITEVMDVGSASVVVYSV